MMGFDRVKDISGKRYIDQEFCTYVQGMSSLTPYRMCSNIFQMLRPWPIYMYYIGNETVLMQL